MHKKDIFSIDNYFIPAGCLLMALGLSFVMLDPTYWNDVEIEPPYGSGTTWEKWNGRTLEQIRQEKGRHYVVKPVVKEFPVIGTFFFVEGVVVLLIGLAYRASEKKIIRLWDALDESGGAPVDWLCTSLDLKREFVIGKLKFINAQRQTCYIYERDGDRIIRVPLIDELNVSVQCGNCEKHIDQTVPFESPNPPRCPSCGSAVSAKQMDAIRKEAVSKLPYDMTAVAASDFNIALFMGLLFVFYPGALFYGLKMLVARIRR